MSNKERNELDDSREKWEKQKTKKRNRKEKRACTIGDQKVVGYIKRSSLGVIF